MKRDVLNVIPVDTLSVKEVKKMAKNNYWVSPDPNGWRTRKEGAARASGIFDTQKQAEDFARNIMKNNSGGELITQSQHGLIRSKDTINSFDPNPPKDLEH